MYTFKNYLVFSGGNGPIYKNIVSTQRLKLTLGFKTLDLLQYTFTLRTNLKRCFINSFSDI